MLFVYVIIFSVNYFTIKKNLLHLFLSKEYIKYKSLFNCKLSKKTMKIKI